jgi:hypothetical protein
MSHRATFRALACLVMIVFTAGTLLAEPAAMLEPTGSVTVNHVSVARTSAVFSGDRVETGADSRALISANGANVLLASNSSMSLDRGSVSVDRGTAMLTVTPGMSSRAGNLTISAAKGERAMYEVHYGARTIDVTARTSAVNIAMNGKTLLLAAPASMSFARPDAPAAASPAAPANLNEWGDMRDRKAVWVGVGAAVAAGLIVWFTTGNNGEASTSAP